MKGILTQREQMSRKMENLRLRLTQLLPSLMEEEGIDMWLTIGGDFNEEPLLDALTPVRPLSLTILAICRDRNGLSLLCDGSEGELCHGFYTGIRRQGEDAFSSLSRLLDERQPTRIAINTSADFRILDGLSHQLYLRLCAAVGEKWTGRLVSAQNLGLRFLETRLPQEIEDFRSVCAVSRQLIYDTYTRDVITPGKTTTADVEWWMRQVIRDSGMDYTWGPNANLQRRGDPGMMCGYEDEHFVIQPGDLLHIDFGVRTLGLETDMQYLAYVLRDGETEAPAGLQKAFSRCLQMQDIYLSCLRPGKTGNEIRREIVAAAEQAGLEAMVYSHPVGTRTHGVGPSIGRFSVSGDVLPQGELTVHENTCYAMELNVRERIPEWDGQKIYIFTEDDVVVIGGKAELLAKRQEELILI